jgi:DNA-binding transcriptional ArsR family regulator
MGGMVPDYELATTVDADTPEKMRAIIDPVRGHILDLVLERAATVTELALALGKPKSSIAYHVDVLLDAGMLQVVRTRKVRAMEEKFYGRTGRTIVFCEHALPSDAVPHNFLAQALGESNSATVDTMESTLRHARIPAQLAGEFFARVHALAEEFTTLPRDGDVVYGFVAALYATDHPTLPEPQSSVLKELPVPNAPTTEN